MYHSFKLSAVLLFYRNTIASVSHGHKGILKHVFVGGRTDHSRELAVDLLIGQFHISADVF